MILILNVFFVLILSTVLGILEIPCMTYLTVFRPHSSWLFLHDILCVVYSV